MSDWSASSAFWTALETRGEAPALITETGSIITYQALAAKADDWAARLATVWSEAGGTGSGQLLIGLEISPRVEIIAAYLGALRAGHAVLLSDCQTLRPGQPIRETYRPNLHIMTAADGTAETTAETSVEISVAETDPAPLHPDLRVLLSTSGTTGAPKLVRLSEQNVAANAAQIADYLELDPSERAITTLPLYYSYGMSVLHAHLAAGAALILTRDSITSPTFWELFRSQSATSMALVPHQFDLLDSLKFDTMALPSLRYITQAGGKLPRPSVERFARLGVEKGWQLFIMYGQTEAAPRMAYVPPDMLLEAPDVMGQPIPGGRLWLTDDDGAQITGSGQAGELFYQGPNVMMGYAEARDELDGAPGPDILPTGDIAERTEGGLFRIVGRKKRFVKLYGLRLSLDQMDQALAAGGFRGFSLSADDRLVVLHPDPEAGPGITAHLAEAYDLPPDAILTAPLEETPLLSSGKVDYRGLQSIAMDAAAADAAARADSSATEPLRAVIARATRSTEIRDEQSFTDLGGDSLGFLQVTMALEARLNHIPEGWERMPVAMLEQIRPLAPGWGSLSGDVIARVVAVSLIVANHVAGDWPLGGGTWALFLIFGFSFARFNRPAISDGRGARTVLSMLYPILPLYYAMLIGVLLIGKSVEPTMFTLTNNFSEFGGSGFLVSPNWFVSTYVQILIGLVAILSIPVVTRRMNLDPWKMGMVALGICFAVSLAYQWSVADIKAGAEERRDWVFILRTPLVCAASVMTGWCVYCAQGQRRIWITAAAVVLNALIFPGGTLTHFVVIAGLGLLLLSNVSIAVPRLVSTAMRMAAGAALFVYLLHALPVHVFLYETTWREDLGKFLAILIVVPLSFLLAIAVQRAFDVFDSIVLKLWRQVRAGGA